MLFWQAPTLLNPHFAIGTKDQEGSRIFYEPLAAWDPDGNLVPVLAAEIPDIENGGVAPDGMSVTWKLKKDVQWHDGQPFTADDVVFNWRIRLRPGNRRHDDRQLPGCEGRKDRSAYRARSFREADAVLGRAPSSAARHDHPEHLFEPYKGANSRDAPANLKPVGTGPYRFVDFKPGDLVKGERNPAYHVPNRPYFDTIEMKGGGDAVSAARAVIQTGEYDYAWNMQVEDEILLRLENGGNARGRIEIVPGGASSTSSSIAPIPGPKSTASVRAPRPSIRCSAILRSGKRSACWSIAPRWRAHIYGRTGIATANFINNPERFVSKNTSWEFNIDKANQLLEEAGWKRGPDGIRAKDDKKLKLVFQTSINAPRQKTQAIVKQACQKAGIDIELKSVTPSVYFSSDVANPDTARKFYSDIQMYTIGTPSVPDPDVSCSSSCPGKSLRRTINGRAAT